LVLSGLSISGSALAAESGPEAPAPEASTPPPQATKKTAPGAAAQKNAEDAGERAAEAAKSGKTLVAKRLKKLAGIWKRVAAAQEKAAKLEEEAAAIERQTLELKSKARKAHSLVEQTENRRARALARLRKLGLSDPEKPAPRKKPAADYKGAK
jgi:hypothetical protein